MFPGRFALIVVVTCLGACTWNNYDGPVGDGGNPLGDGALDAGAKPAKLPAPMRDMGVYVGNATNDHRVYVVGGRDAQGKASKAVNVYDPATNTWTASIDMSLARYALGVGAFMTDNIVAVGGFDDGGNAVGVVEVRDPFAGTWTPGPPMPTARGAFAVSGSGELIVSGGATSENGPPIDKTEWLQVTRVWSSKGGNLQPLVPMPTPRAWLGGSQAPGGEILAIGGTPNLSTVESFNVNLNTWTTTRSNMPTGRGRFATAQGCLTSACMLTFVVGGRSAAGVVNAFEVYDPGTNTWTQLPPMPTAREGLVAAYVGSGVNAYVLAIGGYDGVNTLDVVEAYNVTTKTWR